MDFYKDFPERSDAGTATTPDGGVVAGSDKLNDNDYALVGANSTGSNSQGKGYKVKFSSIYNYLKGKFQLDFWGVDKLVVGGMNKFSQNQQIYSAGLEFAGWNAEIEGKHGKKPIKMQVNGSGNIYFPNMLDLFSFDDGDVCTLSFRARTWGSVNECKVLIEDGSYNSIFSPNVSDVGGVMSYHTFTFKAQRSALSILIRGAGQLFIADLKLERGNIATDWSPSDRDKQDSIGSLAASYITERYSIDEEQALTRRMIANDPTVVEQFEAYNAYCEECKTRAKEELANQPQVLPADSLDAQQ